MTQQDYQKAVEWLFVQAPNYQINGAKAYKPGLDNIRELCAFFQNPQDKIKTIHIGGTNGKGSTSNMLASVLQEQGYRVGLYNSPHLIDFTERIKVNGENCRKNFVFEFIKKLKQLPSNIRPSFFEFTTIMAFEYFFKENVDFAIIEVGLGGRLDSTNIIHPLVAAITNVSLDHTDILGNTIAEIAVEKAGIIKSNVPIISGDDNLEVKKIIRQKAEEKKAKFVDATLLNPHLPTDLRGNYQGKNIKVVAALVDQLQKLGVEISDENLEKGLLKVYKNTKFMGRWFIFSKKPLTICDTAHNKAGLAMVMEQLAEISGKKHLILGFVNDKKVEDIIQLLDPAQSYYFVKPSVERGRSAETYQDLLTDAGLDFQLFGDVQSGYEQALKNCAPNETIFIGGSNFVVGDFLQKNLAVSQ